MHISAATVDKLHWMSSVGAICLIRLNLIRVVREFYMQPLLQERWSFSVLGQRSILASEMPSVFVHITTM